MTKSILLEVSGSLARITLNRPHRLNAIDFEMGARLHDIAMDVTSTSGFDAILLTAEGPSFCSGGDVLAMSAAGATGADVTRAAKVINEGIDAIVSSTIPVVAAVRGSIAGGGIGLMLMADYIVAAPDMHAVGKYAAVGLSPDLGVTTFLADAIGRQRALQMMLADTGVGAERALAWGLVAEVDPDPEARALEIATSWIAGASAAYGQAKRLIRSARTRSLADSLSDEATTIGAAFDGPEAQQRVAAFSRAAQERNQR